MDIGGSGIGEQWLDIGEQWLPLSVILEVECGVVIAFKWLKSGPVVVVVVEDIYLDVELLNRVE